jgi:tRNA 2-thiouridine synthesizing protein A
MQHQYTSKATARWDAGETGCSQLIVGLRRNLERLTPGETLEVVARDAGAPIDLWVWCRMTGHHLISEAHPVYVIQRNDG